MAKEKIDILHEAKNVVHGPRHDSYGSPLDNHTRTAQLFTAYLSKKYPGITLDAVDVCMLNILQKVSRSANAVTRDNLVDIAGYAANVELIWDEEYEVSQRIQGAGTRPAD